MRLWTVHPRYLDARGLVAVWREGLLAQAVLAGRTKGYTRHPQLIRFRRSPDPMACIGSYLHAIHDEALRRGYGFDRRRIIRVSRRIRLKSTVHQLAYEWHHLKAKLTVRDRKRLTTLRGIRRPDPHPSFRIVAGPIEDWELAEGRR